MKIRSCKIIGNSLLAIALVVINLPAIAAPFAEGSQENVVVQMPYARSDLENSKEPETRLLDGERAAFRVPVDLADLNLDDRSDVAVLKDRVRSAAWRACLALDRYFPESAYIPVEHVSDSDCVTDAVTHAMAEAKAIANSNTSRVER